MDPKRHTAAFRAVSRLCQWGEVQLHVPYYVKHEFLSQQHAEIEKALNAIQTNCSAVTRISQHEMFVAYVSEAKTTATEILAHAGRWTRDDFERWLVGCKATQYPVQDDHGRRVTEDYFAGAPPFTSPKQRNDIPDSFIWQTMVDLVNQPAPKQITTLHFICHDQALLKAATKFKGMKTYNKIDLFIESEECQHAIKRITSQAVFSNVLEVTGLLKEDRTFITEIVNSHISESLLRKEVVSVKIPSANNKGIIGEIVKWSPVVFEFDGIDLYGAAELGIPFNTVVSGTVNFQMSKQEWTAILASRMANVHALEFPDTVVVGAIYTINVEGTLVIKMDQEAMSKEDLSDKKLVELAKSAAIEIQVDDLSIVED